MIVVVTLGDGRQVGVETNESGQPVWVAERERASASWGPPFKEKAGTTIPGIPGTWEVTS